jgi:5,10-methylenetetrahydromethanopterin reductase
MMDFGIAVATTVDSWQVAQRAEALGFKQVWFYDTQLLNPDVFICMGLAAQKTERIRLGTGVAIPSNRIAPVAANALATLNKLAPGRIDFGVGTGYTGRRTMGLRAIKLAALKAYVEQVRLLCMGETVSWEFEGKTNDIAFLNPDMGLINVKDPIGVHVSALGPKARETTAELGAGWINFGSDPKSVGGTLEHMQQVWRGCGHAPEALHSTLFSLGCVLQPGEAADSERAVAQAGPYVAVFFHNLVETTAPGAMERVIGKRLSDALEQYREIYLKYPHERRHLFNHRGHLMFLRPEERFLVARDLIESMTFTAEAAVLRDRLAQFEAAGYNQFTVQLVPGHEDAINAWAEVFGLKGPR